MSAGAHELRRALVEGGDPVVIRAGGTDLQERVGALRRRGAPLPAVVDVGRSDLDGIVRADDGSYAIGATTTIAELAASAALASDLPALSAAAGALATPQIRAVATVGGNLLQATRCPYVRHLDVSCWHTGGRGCPARDGVHDRAVVVDLGPCAQPHPSTLAVALLAHEATAEVHGAAGVDGWSLAAVLGDGSDASRTHQLDGDELLAALRVPPGWADERGSYVRAAGRALAEWPLVEVVVRAAVTDVVTHVAVAVGGVATVPLRLPEVEESLIGQVPTGALLATAAATCASRCTPLPQTRYKVDLLVASVRTALEQALGVRDDDGAADS